MTCETVRDLLPELALNVASGDERAAALKHLASCPECRAELESLSEVADALLLLSPAEEPPAGFESKVLGAQRPPRSWIRPVMAVAAVIVAVAVTAGITYSLGATDRRLAAHQREESAGLAAVNGRYFAAAPIRSDGVQEGQVFGYAGDPSWVYVVTNPSMEKDVYEVTALTTSGRRVDLGTFDMTTGQKAWGSLLPVDLSKVQSVRFAGDGGQVYEVTLHTT